jgi:uncharacterized cysteine cluster protein YcgN (CxxCxxCC family)
MTARKTAPAARAKGKKAASAASGKAVRQVLARRLSVMPGGGRGKRVDPARVADEALPFWKRKTLAQMTKREWESLCDGCGKCCVNKLEYEDTGEVVQTDTCCRLLDTHSCQCSDYKNRKKIVPDCIQLTPDVVAGMDWLPRTCAYRLVLQGRDLFWWHKLVSGDPETVHEAGVSARDKVISELEAGELIDHVLDDWL